MLPDRGPVSAQQALRAARRDPRVWDGRATAWLVAQRLLEVVGLRDAPRRDRRRERPRSASGCGSSAGAALSAPRLGGTGGSTGRRRATSPWPAPGGASASCGRPLHRDPLWNWVCRFALRMTLSPAATAGSRPGFSSSAVGYLLTSDLGLVVVDHRGPWPWVRAAWPDGAQGYAVLSVLSRAQWVHPDRLSVLTGLSRDRCDDWRPRRGPAACLAVPRRAPEWGCRFATPRSPGERAASCPSRLVCERPSSSRRAAVALSRGPTRLAPTSADVIVARSSSRDHVRRHRVDEVAERPQPDAVLDGGGGRLGHVDGLVAAGPRRPRRARARRHARQLRAGASPARRPRLDAAPRRPRQSRSVQQVESPSATAQASGLAMNVGPCISTAGLAAGDPARDARGCTARPRASGSRRSAPCPRTSRPGATPRLSPAKERAGAAEAGRDLVEDQQRPCRSATSRSTPQALGA